MKTAKLTYEGGRHWLRFSYDGDLVEALKMEFSACDRAWYPECRAWSFHWTCRDRLVLLLHRHGYRVSSGGEGEAETRLSTPHAALHLLPTAPRPVIDAVFRALVKLHHPDVGGDPERLKTVIGAYERLQAGGA